MSAFDRVSASVCMFLSACSYSYLSPPVHGHARVYFFEYFVFVYHCTFLWMFVAVRRCVDRRSCGLRIYDFKSTNEAQFIVIIPCSLIVIVLLQPAFEL